MVSLIEEIRQESGEQLHFGEIFPTDHVPAIVADMGPIRAEALVWGYDKFDAKDVYINARSETVEEKPLFRNDFLYRRCLLPANGFYVWSQDKQKYYIRRSDSEHIFIGAISRRRYRKNTCIILTKDASSPICDFHNRIPVLIDKDNIPLRLTDPGFASDHIRRDYPLR